MFGLHYLKDAGDCWHWFDTKEELLELLEFYSSMGIERKDFEVAVTYTPDEFKTYFQKGGLLRESFFFAAACGARRRTIVHYPQEKIKKKSVSGPGTELS